MIDDVIPHNAKSEGVEVGNNTTLLQIVSHYTTARAAKEKGATCFWGSSDRHCPAPTLNGDLNFFNGDLMGTQFE